LKSLLNNENKKVGRIYLSTDQIEYQTILN